MHPSLKITINSAYEGNVASSQFLFKRFFVTKTRGPYLRSAILHRNDSHGPMIINPLDSYFSLTAGKQHTS